MIYLDNHSTTQVDSRVFKKMIPYFTEKFNNPHSVEVGKANARNKIQVFKVRFFKKKFSFKIIALGS